ncbi:MAG: PEP-CTERM sorting domain-containing protein [Phycisphaerae bacterium]|nr:PEP-CTERM sorting domain-containing protein [Phycisphaerae bacterium]
MDGQVVPAGTIMHCMRVPEPMSALLLGLGGLFLRQRK